VSPFDIVTAIFFEFAPIFENILVTSVALIPDEEDKCNNTGKLVRPSHTLEELT